MKTTRNFSQAEERLAGKRAMSIARFSEDYAIGRTKAYEELKVRPTARSKNRQSARLSAKTTPKLGSGNCRPCQ